MDHLVDQTVKILTNEPADIYANPTFLPEELNAEYAKYWTDERIDRVLDVLKKHNIALEIKRTLQNSKLRHHPQSERAWNQVHLWDEQCRCRFRQTGILPASRRRMRSDSRRSLVPTMSVRGTREVVLYNKW